MLVIFLLLLLVETQRPAQMGVTALKEMKGILQALALESSYTESLGCNLVDHLLKTRMSGRAFQQSWPAD